jgi:hypothetical protein
MIEVKIWKFLTLFLEGEEKGLDLAQTQEQLPLPLQCKCSYANLKYKVMFKCKT